MSDLYAMLIEREADGGYHASFPDLPGVYGVGQTLAEVRRAAGHSFKVYMDDLSGRGVAIPKASTKVAYVAVPERYRGNLAKVVRRVVKNVRKRGLKKRVVD